MCRPQASAPTRKPVPRTPAATRAASSSGPHTRCMPLYIPTARGCSWPLARPGPAPTRRARSGAAPKAKNCQSPVPCAAITRTAAARSARAATPASRRRGEGARWVEVACIPPRLTLLATPRHPDEHGLGLERHAEASPDPVGDLPGQRDEPGRGARAAVRERERVLRGDRDARRVAVAAAEARALDEPCRRRLHRPVGLRERGRAVGELRRVNEGVREERAGRPRVVVAGVEHHALAPAQL